MEGDDGGANERNRLKAILEVRRIPEFPPFFRWTHSLASPLGGRVGAAVLQGLANND